MTRDEGLVMPYVANFDNLQPVPRERLIRRVGSLSDAKLAAACRSLPHAVGC